MAPFESSGSQSKDTICCLCMFVGSFLFVYFFACKTVRAVELIFLTSLSIPRVNYMPQLGTATKHMYNTRTSIEHRSRYCLFPFKDE